jgi:hemerythrin
MSTNVQDLAWSQELSTDIMSLDIQHKILASKVEALKLFERSSPIPENAYHFYIELIDDIREHFHFEEKVIKNIGYHDFDHHCKTHNAILNKLCDILNDILVPRDSSRIHKAISYLEHAISGHLSHEDTKIKSYIHRSE